MLEKNKVYKINCCHPDHKIINQTAEIIKRGGIVIFPTETLYGLGTVFDNKKSIAQIYQLRKRPKNMALLILIASKNDLNKYAHTKPFVKRIIQNNWPGPLTIILKKKKTVPNFVTANKKTVAIRMPENKFLLALIKKIGRPIVAPSANLSGGKSPMTAQETFKVFFGKVDLILDGGKTKYQQESTILDLTGKKPQIIREGAISRKKIERFIKLN